MEDLLGSSKAELEEALLALPLLLAWVGVVREALTGEGGMARLRLEEEVVGVTSPGALIAESDDIDAAPPAPVLDFIDPSAT